MGACSEVVAIPESDAECANLPAGTRKDHCLALAGKPFGSTFTYYEIFCKGLNGDTCFNVKSCPPNSAKKRHDISNISHTICDPATGGWVGCFKTDSPGLPVCPPWGQQAWIDRVALANSPQKTAPNLWTPYAGEGARRGTVSHRTYPSALTPARLTQPKLLAHPPAASGDWLFAMRRLPRCSSLVQGSSKALPIRPQRALAASEPRASALWPTQPSAA